jgi:hypothetical protein
VDTVTLPDGPKLDDPVATSIPPLEPVVLDELNRSVPLDAVGERLSPVDTKTLPPSEVDDRPADKLMSPPAPLALAPTEKLTEPA